MGWNIWQIRMNMCTIILMIKNVPAGMAVRMEKGADADMSMGIRMIKRADADMSTDIRMIKRADADMIMAAVMCGAW